MIQRSLDDLALWHGAEFREKVRCLAAHLLKEWSDGRLAWISDLSVSESYVHPNGFVKLVLGTSSDGLVRARVHFWPAEPGRRPTPDIHGHCFAAVSHVFVGRLRDVRWAATGSGTKYRVYKYMTKGGGDTFNLRCVGVSFAEVCSEAVICAGQTYGMERDILHQTIVQPSQPAVTLFLEDRRAGLAPTRVLTNRSIPEHGVMLAPALNRDQYLAWMEIVVDLLRSSVVVDS